MTQYPNEVQRLIDASPQGAEQQENEWNRDQRVFRKWFLEAEWVWVTEQLVDELKEGKGGIAQ